MGNKEIVLKAMNELFHEKDSTAIERYWHESYQQHNPSMINGHEGLKNLLPFLDVNFKWQPGIIVEENDLVITHSLVNGWGAVPVIVVDIFRLKDGKIAEHWDVVQEEVPASKSANGNAMTSFNSTTMKKNLIGNRYIMDVGVLKTELYFETEESMIFTIIEGGSLTEKGYSERVKISIAEVRPEVFMVAWKEISGATVTHVEDHQNSIIYSNATLPDGSFYTMKGTIKPV